MFEMFNSLYTLNFNLPFQFITSMYTSVKNNQTNEEKKLFYHLIKFNEIPNMLNWNIVKN